MEKALKKTDIEKEAIDQTLRMWAGTELLSSVFTRGESSLGSEELLEGLAYFRSMLPANPLRDRMLGPAPSEARFKEWQRSRTALLAAFRNLGVDVAREGAKTQYSFSHTGDAVLALVVCGDFKSLGVDLERKDREVSAAAFARFHHPDELSIFSDPLGHWILKEACFKANPRSKETVISDYRISARGASADEFILICEKTDGAIFRARLGEIEEYRFGVALARA